VGGAAPEGPPHLWGGVGEADGGAGRRRGFQGRLNSLALRGCLLDRLFLNAHASDDRFAAPANLAQWDGTSGLGSGAGTEA
jgi:hypothetical protein